jgi:hypothetical protein
MLCVLLLLYCLLACLLAVHVMLFASSLRCQAIYLVTATLHYNDVDCAVSVYHSA